MALYTWRVTNGAFGTGGNWTLNGAPAANPPGTGDTADFAATAGGTVTGSGSVMQLDIDPGASAPWLFEAALAAGAAFIASTTEFRGSQLTLSGIASTTAGDLPYAGNINAPVTLDGSALIATGGYLNVGAAYSPLSASGARLSLTSGSTLSALDLAIGAGATGAVIVNDSSLATQATVANPTGGNLTIGLQATVSGVTTAGNGTLGLSGGLVTVGNGLVVGEDAGSVGTLDVGSAGITVSGAYSEVGNLAGSTGAVTVTSGGTFTLASGELLVGNHAGADGTLTISSGGQLVSTEAAQTANYILEIGYDASSAGEPAADGAVTVTGSGALLSMGSNGIAVGYHGSGTLTVQSGGIVETQTANSNDISALSVGRFGSATVNVTGSGSLIDAIGSIYDGRGAGGSGVINVTSGGMITETLDATGGGGIGIGTADTTSGQTASGGSGTLNVNTGGVIDLQGNLNVGANGTSGTVVLGTGGIVSATGFIDVGTGSSSTGGTGSVTIGGGAKLITTGPHSSGNASIAIANQASTTGEITVSGGGSVLDAGGDRISVGSRGNGMLVVENGATASAGSTLYPDQGSEAGFSVGAYTTGSGATTVSGAGSTLSIDGAITLAGALTSAGGTGALTASAGGVVTATGVVLWSGGTLAADAQSLVQIGATPASGTGVVVEAGSTVSAHGGVISAAVANAGMISNTGALTVSGNVSGPGALDLLAGSTTVISGSLAGQSVAFTGQAMLATTGLAGLVDVTAAQLGDVVDLLGMSAVVTGDTVQSGAGGLTFTGLAPGLVLEAGSDGQGGTDVTVACYLRGTAILTDAGERPVEALRIGDHLITARGERRRLRWIGRRSYGGRFLLRNRALLPIRFTAGSLGDRRPHRDLFVSPSHAMFVDGILIPASDLVNGRTIRQIEQIDSVDYYHVELATHDVILAEGTPSETFLDDGSRGIFHNAAEFSRRYPNARVPTEYCAPRLTDGIEVELVRRRLAALAEPWIDHRPDWREEDSLIS